MPQARPATAHWAWLAPTFELLSLSFILSLSLHFTLQNKSLFTALLLLPAVIFVPTAQQDGWPGLAAPRPATTTTEVAGAARPGGGD